jgi:hypothetical protein
MLGLATDFTDEVKYLADDGLMLLNNLVLGEKPLYDEIPAAITKITSCWARTDADSSIAGQGLVKGRLLKSAEELTRGRVVFVKRKEEFVLATVVEGVDTPGDVLKPDEVSNGRVVLAKRGKTLKRAKIVEPSSKDGFDWQVKYIKGQNSDDYRVADLFTLIEDKPLDTWRVKYLDTGKTSTKKKLYSVESDSCRCLFSGCGTIPKIAATFKGPVDSTIKEDALNYSINIGSFCMGASKSDLVASGLSKALTTLGGYLSRLSSVSPKTRVDAANELHANNFKVLSDVIPSEWEDDKENAASSQSRPDAEPGFPVAEKLESAIHAFSATMADGEISPSVPAPVSSSADTSDGGDEERSDEDEGPQGNGLGFKVSVRFNDARSQRSPDLCIMM